MKTMYTLCLPLLRAIFAVAKACLEPSEHFYIVLKKYISVK